MDDLTRTVLFDTESTGHHREYLQHVVRYVKSENPDYGIVLVVHPSIAAVLGQESGADCIEVIEIDSDTIAELHDIGSLWRRSLREWEVADEYARAVEADHCVLMSLNWFQFALGLPSAHVIPYTLSGILFFPYVRIESGTNGLLSQIAYQMRRFRKCATLRWMMRNTQLRTVFVLNDPGAANQLNHRVDAQKQRFRALPDPVLHPDEMESGKELREVYNIDDDRSIFLFAGTVSERKGILAALDAFEHISAEERSRSALLVLGRLKEEMAGEVKQRVRRLREFEDFQIRTDFRFLSDSEFNRAFRGCDTVLAPYRRTEGSSGILGHAARVRRPVIGPESGLIGDLIRKYHLGITVETASPVRIAEALSRTLSGHVQIDTDAAVRYVEERTPEQFAQHILPASGGAH